MGLNNNGSSRAGAMVCHGGAWRQLGADEGVVAVMGTPVGVGQGAVEVSVVRARDWYGPCGMSQCGSICAWLGSAGR